MWENWDTIHMKCEPTTNRQEENSVFISQLEDGNRESDRSDDIYHLGAFRVMCLTFTILLTLMIKY